MKRRLILVPLVALVALVPLALVVAILTDTQSVSGTLNVSSASADLYICDLTNTSTTTETCPGIGDDSLGDELIFETTENLVPGQETWWDLRLLNLDATIAWDISIYPPTVTVTEVNDPGNDCGSVPGFRWSILGKAGDDVNDNHASGCPASGCWKGEYSGNAMRIHVAPGDYEDVRLRAGIDLYSFPNECRENAWDISAAIDVTQD